MTVPAESWEQEQLRDAVVEALGFELERDRLKHLAEAVQRRIRELGIPDLARYLQLLRSTVHQAREIPILAELVTVTETFFCRNSDQIHAFVETVTKSDAMGGTKRLRVLSAGCASGEEPFTLAMALSDAIPDIATWDLKIVGLDVNPAMLAKASRARYSTWSLRATPEALKSRYFSRVGTDYQLCSGITDMVEFRTLNLAEKEEWSLGEFVADSIFCRNVIMYFAPEVARRVVSRLTQLLSPGGYLFLGHAETLRGLSQDYRLRHKEGTFYYQKVQGSTSEQLPLYSARDHRREPLPVVQAVTETSTWFEAIQSATRRVTQIADTHGAAQSASFEGSLQFRTLAPVLNGLPEVFELMRQERFTDALRLLDTMPTEVSSHPDGLLFTAVLLTNHGRIAEAEGACEKLLESDDLNAGAHYLKALCREHAGDHRGALEHDRIAGHLDPTFSMPHLHAGLLAKREQDSSGVRRGLERALLLLAREDASRLVLFGGGFSRDALTALCQNELARVGDEA